jgi:hypothetical protein
MSRPFLLIFSTRIPAPVSTGTILCGHKFTQINTVFGFFCGKILAKSITDRGIIERKVEKNKILRNRTPVLRIMLCR